MGILLKQVSSWDQPRIVPKIFHEEMTRKVHLEKDQKRLLTGSSIILTLNEKRIKTDN